MFNFIRLMSGWMLASTLLVSGSSGMVLCIGNDGHLAVEPEQHSHCGNEHDATDQGDENTAVGDTCSAMCEVGGCVDVPLESANLSYAPKPLTQDLLQNCSAGQLFLIGSAPFAQAGVHGCQRPVFGATHILTQSLLEKRTIVLLV